ncbi:aldose 1-epimerase [Burkholderia pseudomallei]|nr:aldose 1-epimerase [Burkholderia pseudomallei]
MTKLVELKNSEASAVVLPRHGAGLASFDFLWRGSRLPAFRPLITEPQHEHDLALYLLAPFSNRIGGGGFAWNGRRHDLRPNVEGEPCPLHGDAWQQHWTVMDQGRTHVTLQLLSRSIPPFAYDAEITWTLDGPSLSGALTLIHRGEDPMPYGGGFHPWLVRDSDTQLHARADGWWSEDSLHLPKRWHALVDNDSSGFGAPRSLPSNFFNTVYTGWHGRADIWWPGRGLALQIEAQTPLNRYIVYSPGAEADFFCFEPVSHDVNAHNAPSPLKHGLVELAEGESLHLSARFTATLR